jgi:hypothetical protein
MCYEFLLSEGSWSGKDGYCNTDNSCPVLLPSSLVVHNYFTTNSCNKDLHNDRMETFSILSYTDLMELHQLLLPACNKLLHVSTLSAATPTGEWCLAVKMQPA